MTRYRMGELVRFTGKIEHLGGLTSTAYTDAEAFVVGVYACGDWHIYLPATNSGHRVAADTLTHDTLERSGVRAVAL